MNDCASGGGSDHQVLSYLIKYLILIKYLFVTESVMSKTTAVMLVKYIVEKRMSVKTFLYVGKQKLVKDVDDKCMLVKTCMLANRLLMKLYVDIFTNITTGCSLQS